MTLIPMKALPRQVKQGRLARRFSRWLAWCFVTSTVVPMLWAQPAASVEAPASDVLPTANEILERYVEVTGGRAAYEARTSEITHGTVKFTSAGIQGELTTYSKGGNYRNSVQLPGLGVVENGVTDGVAWEKTDILGPRIKEGAELADAVREATLNSTLLWEELFKEVSVVGTSEVAGEPCYEVRMAPEEGSTITTCYSVESGLALHTSTRAATQMGEVDVQVRMLDYKDFNGVLAPSHIQESAAAQNIDVIIESVDVNQDIPDEVFALPEDVSALLAVP